MMAMVLAAGIGQRLRPLTIFWAKPALPILGTPLIEYTLAQLERAGIHEVVVNLHHQPETITRVLDEVAKRGWRIHYSREPTLLGTAGGLKQAASILGDETFVLVNGDTLVDVDLAALVDWHRQRGGDATLLVRPKPTGSDYTALGLDPGARVVAIGGEPSPPHMFAGVWVFEPSVFDRIPASRFSGLEVEVLPDLVKERAVFGCTKDVAWFDIGSPKRYLSACLKMARQGLFQDLWRVERLRLANRPDSDAIVLAGSGTTIGRDVRFLGESVLGSHCRVERGAVVQRSVLWDQVVIGGGAIVRNSIIGDGVSLPAGSRIENKVVLKPNGDVEQVRASERMDDHVVAPIKN